MGSYVFACLERDGAGKKKISEPPRCRQNRRRANGNKTEAKDKRIREMRIHEPYPESDEFYVSLYFDDETEITLDLTARLGFVVKYLQWVDGDSELLKEYPPRLLRS